MLANKGARIGGIASGRAEGWMVADFKFPKINDERVRGRSVAPSTPFAAGASEELGSWIQDDDGPSDFVTISADSDFSMISKEEAYPFMRED